MLILHRARTLGSVACKSVGICMGNNSSSPDTVPSSISSSTHNIQSPKPAIAANSMSTITNAVIPASHAKCINQTYPRNNNIVRLQIPEGHVDWTVEFDGYLPVDYTAPSVASKPVWADIDYKNEEDCPQAAWNTLDGTVDRRSHMGPYKIINGLPRNPVGRTGVCSRGLLGRWGPNHAADPIVTRWKRTEDGTIVTQDGQPVMQFVAIQRRDSGQWALPGGMVDPGEKVSVTLKREFQEEALDAMNMHKDQLECVHNQVSDLFHQGVEVYRGYVDDPRNTDNAWMETVAVNFHDETGDSVGKFKLHAGDDAVGVRWTDMRSELALYASHIHFLKAVAKHHNACW